VRDSSVQQGKHFTTIALVVGLVSSKGLVRSRKESELALTE
jgi:hypothetical protein